MIFLFLIKYVSYKTVVPNFDPQTNPAEIGSFKNPKQKIDNNTKVGLRAITTEISAVSITVF